MRISGEIKKTETVPVKTMMFIDFMRFFQLTDLKKSMREKTNESDEKYDLKESVSRGLTHF